MKYCVIIYKDEIREKLIKIANVLDLKVHHLTEFNSINKNHVKNFGCNYYLILYCNKSLNFDISHLYIPSGRIIKLDTFLKKMFQTSITKNKQK